MIQSQYFVDLPRFARYCSTRRPKLSTKFEWLSHRKLFHSFWTLAINCSWFIGLGFLKTEYWSITIVTLSPWWRLCYWRHHHGDVIVIDVIISRLEKTVVVNCEKLFNLCDFCQFSGSMAPSRREHLRSKIQALSAAGKCKREIAKRPFLVGIRQKMDSVTWWWSER